jgi:DNA gyrase subunit B
MKEKKPTTEYTGKEIQILEGLEPIRKRPGMYIGSTGAEGFHHLLKEIIYNSIDEALAGFCNEIKVTLLTKRKVRVEDNGRGIPVDIHPQTKKSTLETVVTTIHAGGKFGGKAYVCSGGLHGVGISAVCALSEHMEVIVARDGFLWKQEYSRGKPKTKVEKIGKTDKTGTTVIFEPDPEIFEKKIVFDKEKILKFLRQQAFLTPKLKIYFSDKTQSPSFEYCFYFEGGILSYLSFLTKSAKKVHQKPFYVKEEKENALVEVALIYTQDYESFEEGFVNNVLTLEGGTHLTGFRTGLTKALNNFAKEKNFLKEKDESFTGEDVREGLNAICSIKIKEPQFEGQTKGKLGNPEVKRIVEEVMTEKFKEWLEKNPQEARLILEKCLLAQKARKAAKSAKESILKKAKIEGLSLPGKLADCIEKDPAKREIFIVEGESAGGSTRQARDRRFQAVLPIRGKILNVEKTSLDKALTSKEIRSIVVALGTHIAENFDIEKIRYKKIIIACDADSDGNHIRTLLLTLFYRYFKPAIEKGYLYIAQPPLYKIQIGKEIKYAFSDKEKNEILKKTSKEKAINIQRYKGLGEMNPEELWETTMNPEKRVLIKVSLEDAEEAERIFDILMGKEVLPRKQFIQTYAKEAKNLDI